jgi:hypothetical protein
MAGGRGRGGKGGAAGGSSCSTQPLSRATEREQQQRGMLVSRGSATIDAKFAHSEMHALIEGA